MILLLGSTGYVGKAFAQFFNKNNIDYTTFCIRYPFDANEFRNFLLRNKITHVFNCAGYTGKPNVDACEVQKDETLLANAILPKQIAEICCNYNVALVHISSGCIYTDCNCDQAFKPLKEYQENDAPNFCFDANKYSWYSATKALGEQLIENYACTIVRLRIPFNGEANDRSYINKIINYPVLLNATNSFTYLPEFARNVVYIASNSYKFRMSPFNLTQPGHLNTQQVVAMLKEKNLIKDKLYFKSIDEFNKTVAAPRSNCVLDASKAIAHKLHMTPIEDAMMMAIDQLSFNINNK